MEKFFYSENEERIAFIEGDDIVIIDYFGVNSYIPVIDGFISFLHYSVGELSEAVANYYEDEFFLDIFSSLLDKHIYLKLFEPEFVEDTLGAYQEYVRYLCDMQNLYYMLYKWCFDQSFHYEELGKLNASQRLHVCAKFLGRGIPQEITQVNMLDGDALDGYDDEEFAPKSKLEEMYDLPGGYIDYISKQKAEIIPEFRLKNTADALALEFYQMIKLNIKLKKCKNCDEYFRVRTKRNPDYCDRIIDGGAQTCQQKHATQSFKSKNKDNAAYNIFNRYYKRYHSRRKVGTIKSDAFNIWNRQACVMRDECIDGKRKIEDFEQWCYDSFPNRKKKTSDAT